MWRYWIGKGKSEEELKGNHEEEAQLDYKRLRDQVQQQLITLTKQYSQSESIFKSQYGVSEHQITLTNTFQELITTIQGLLAIIGQLKSEYDSMQQQVIEGKRAKKMLNNHMTTINDIQESHSQQVNRIYEEKRMREEEMNETIETLRKRNQQLEGNMEQVMTKINNLYEKNNSLETQLVALHSEKEAIQIKKEQLQEKYKTLVDPVFQVPEKKIIDLENVELQFIFYYSKLKNKIIGYLNLQDILKFQRTSKFYYYSLKREIGFKFKNHFKRFYERRVSKEIENAKLYEKIYQLFPLENIKINAFKYLHFRIKPATYMLPFLQEQQVQITKKEQEDEKEKGGKFSWKFWGDKKSEKKEQKDKFSLSSLKNQQEFKKIQQKIELTFKNILQVKMPQDLNYFSNNMQKQLQELKQDLIQSKQGKLGQTEWTAELYCLSRYMYHEINELFNLLQVIFGQLIIKNKNLLQITEEYEYLKENQLVLRNLIENLSGDKATIEKKFLMMENTLTKKTLQKQTLNAHVEQLTADYQNLSAKYLYIERQHASCQEIIDKGIDARRKLEQRFTSIKEQLDQLEKMPSRVRKESIGSVGSEQHLPSDLFIK